MQKELRPNRTTPTQIRALRKRLLHVPRPRPLQGHDSAAQDHAVPLSANGHQDADSFLLGLGEEIRPFLPARVGHHGGTDQLRGLRCGGGEKVLQCRHLLAGSHDNAVTGQTRDEDWQLLSSLLRGQAYPG